MLGDRYDQNVDLVITIKSLIYYLRIKKAWNRIPTIPRFFHRRLGLPGHFLLASTSLCRGFTCHLFDYLLSAFSGSITFNWCRIVAPHKSDRTFSSCSAGFFTKLFAGFGTLKMLGISIHTSLCICLVPVRIGSCDSRHCQNCHHCGNGSDRGKDSTHFHTKLLE